MDSHSHVTRFVPPILPLEVYERIIDWCAVIDLDWKWHRHPRQARRIPNNRLVLACALVCRSWLPRARNQLLSSIEVLVSSEFNRLCKCIRPSDSLGQFIRSLKLGRLLATPIPNAWIHLLPQQLSSTLSCLSEMTLINCPFPTHTSFVMLLSGFKSLTTLTLISCDFTTFTDLARILLAFSSLSSLSLDAVNWKQIGYHSTRYKVPRCARLRLRTLSITRMSSRNVESFLEWLFLTPSVGNFEVLRLPCHHRRCAELIRDVLHLSRTSIHQLHLRFDKMEAVDGALLSPVLCRMFYRRFRERFLKRLWPDLLSLKDLSNIRELDLSIISVESILAIHEILCSISSTQVSIIRLELKGKTYAGMDTSDWGQIDTLLSQKRFSNLRKLNLGLSTIGYWNKTDISVRRLPLLHSRGILRESCRDQWYEDVRNAHTTAVSNR